MQPFDTSCCSANTLEAKPDSYGRTISARSLGVTRRRISRDVALRERQTLYPSSGVLRLNRRGYNESRTIPDCTHLHLRAVAQLDGSTKYTRRPSDSPFSSRKPRSVKSIGEPARSSRVAQEA
jgi:hypothetical protein